MGKYVKSEINQKQEADHRENLTALENIFQIGDDRINHRGGKKAQIEPDFLNSHSFLQKYGRGVEEHDEKWKKRERRENEKSLND